MRRRRKRQYGPLAALALAGAFSVATSLLHVAPESATAAGGDPASPAQTPVSLTSGDQVRDRIEAGPTPTPTASASPSTPASQGRPTARPTPRPAPPPAPKPRPVHVVGLGDSVAAGSASAGPSYVERTATLLGAQRKAAADARVVAGNGMTSGQLLWRVTSDPTTRAALARATVVVIEIGANDYADDTVSADCVQVWSCYAGELGGMKSNLTRITAATRALAPTAQIVLVGYWNVWADGAVGRANGNTYTSIAANLTASHNALVRQVAAAQGAAYTSTIAAMRSTGDVTDLLAPDGEHPNSSGHAAMARAVVAALPRRDS